jgi:hypothetical protein
MPDHVASKANRQYELDHNQEQEREEEGKGLIY